MSEELVLDRNEVAFIAARVRRLCHKFNYPVPDQDDCFIVSVSGSLIGAILGKLELEERHGKDN